MAIKLARRATNVSLDPELVAAARALSINVSRACEDGLATAVKKERERQWLAENREAIEGHNRWVAEHGLPLAKYRLF
jgi:antitoxin CcdA